MGKREKIQEIHKKLWKLDTAQLQDVDNKVSTWVWVNTTAGKVKAHLKQRNKTNKTFNLVASERSLVYKGLGMDALRSYRERTGRTLFESMKVVGNFKRRIGHGVNSNSVGKQKG